MPNFKMHRAILQIVMMTTALCFTTVHADANAAVLTFEELQDFEYVQSYYSGGLGGNGSGPGPKYSVVFSPSTVTYVNDGPSGAHFNGQPTPGTAVAFQQSGAYMNSANGFVNSLSFYYGNPNGDDIIYIYSGVNGTGDRLATLFLPQTSFHTTHDGANSFDMVFRSVSFSGVAKSVDFGGLAHRGYVDDISIVAVPEPSTWAMLLAGLGFIGFRAHRSSQRHVNLSRD